MTNRNLHNTLTKNDVTYHILTKKRDLDQVAELQQAIWGMAEIDVMPAHAMMAFSRIGGGVFGAEADGKIVACAVAFPAWRKGKEEGRFLWSEFAGVHPNYQGKGIGFHLKHFQYTWASAHHYSAIHWTFDPLQRRNANFNLSVLPTVSNRYIVNAYGYMDDAINAGMQSDRLEAQWIINPDAPTTKTTLPANLTYPLDAFLVLADSQGQPIQQTRSTQPYHFIEIPPDIARLKRDNMALARAWQLAVRQAMQKAFAQGYTAVKFISHKDRYFYVLKHL